MPLENAYCSVESVQKETGNSDAELTDWFIECINLASRWIDDHCLTDFFAHDHSSSAYTVPDMDVMGYSLYLPWKIVTLTEVASADGVVDAALYSYDVGRRPIHLKSKANWLPVDKGPVARSGYHIAFQGPGGGYTSPITVKGTFGHAAPPASVARACTKLAATWSHEKRVERVAQDGSRTSILDERIPDDCITLLKRFRRLVY